MTAEQRMVREFHRAFSRPAPEKFTPLGEEQRRLRARLVLEEALEFVDACGFDVALKKLHFGPGKRTAVTNIEIGGAVSPAGDPVAMIDALCDAQYVVLGTAVEMGADLEPFFAEVHRSNMAKLHNGRPVVDPGGKVLKPATWTPPDIGRLLDRIRDLDE